MAIANQYKLAPTQYWLQLLSMKDFKVFFVIRYLTRRAWATICLHKND